MKKAIILDFDGTLVNTASIIHKIYNKLADENGFRTMTLNDYKRLRKSTFRVALKWSGIKFWQTPTLLRRGRELFLEEIDSVIIFTGMNDAIENLKASGWDIFILSKNGDTAVEKILTKYKLKSDVVALKRASFFGKQWAINRFLRRYKYQRQKVWLIGDEVKDIQACKKTGINSMAVTWGLQDKSILQKHKPDLLVEKPSQITKELCYNYKN